MFSKKTNSCTHLKKRFQKEKKYLIYKFFIFNLPLPLKKKQIPGYWSTPDSALDRFKSIGSYIFMKNFPKFFKAFGLPGLEWQALEFVLISKVDVDSFYQLFSRSKIFKIGSSKLI